MESHSIQINSLISMEIISIDFVETVWYLYKKFRRPGA